MVEQGGTGLTEAKGNNGYNVVSLGRQEGVIGLQSGIEDSESEVLGFTSAGPQKKETAFISQIQCM